MQVIFIKWVNSLYYFEKFSILCFFWKSSELIKKLYLYLGLLMVEEESQNEVS